MKRFITCFRTVLLVLLMMGVAIPGFSHDFEVDGIYYYYNDDGTTVSVAPKNSNQSWMAYTNDVVVPAWVDYGGMTYTVTVVADSAFYSCPSLRSVTLPETVIAIGHWALARNTNLVSVNIPESVTRIGDWAFANDSHLTSIALGAAVTLGERVFHGCTSLALMTVNPLNPRYDSRENCNAIIERATNSLLYGCKNTVIPVTVTSIAPHAFQMGAAPEPLTIPGTVTSIGDEAFTYCSGLTNLTLEEGVQHIGNEAFSHCHTLAGIMLPATVTTIGEDAFAGCWNVTDIVIDEDNPVYDSRHNCNAIIETATGVLLLGCKNTVIPEGITAIGHSSFAWSKITAVHIPEGVTRIEDYAFDHCYYVDLLSLPSTLSTIGYSAFNGAYINLTNLVFPNSLVSIGGYAFACCDGLQNIDFGNGLQSIGNNAFFSCDGLTELHLPGSLLSIGDNAFLGCSGLTSVEIPASVTHIGMAAFQACENLTQLTVNPASVTFDSRDRCNAVIETATGTLVAGCIATVIPPTVTTLDNGAFCECIGLRSIDIPASVTAIGAHTFDYCYDLDTIALPPHLKTIGNAAFAGCERLVYVKIPDEVTTIGDSAFYDCPWMEYLILGRSVNSIGTCAFYGTNLITLTCRAMEPPVIAGEDSFWHYGNFSNATLCVPALVLNRYRSADYWNLFPTIVGQGDINGDGAFTISDITALISCLLSGNYSAAQLVAADINDDYRLTIRDITALIGLLLSEGNHNPPPSK